MTFPENGARTSIVTLSVSIWAMTSSAATDSPGDFRTAATVPSVIDSPMEATVTSTTGGEEEAAEEEMERRRCGSSENGEQRRRGSENGADGVDEELVVALVVIPRCALELLRWQLLHLQQEAQRHVEPQREQEPEAWPWWGCKRLRKDEDEGSHRLPPNAIPPPVAAVITRCAWPSTADAATNAESSPPSSGPPRDQPAARLRSAEEEIRDIAICV